MEQSYIGAVCGILGFVACCKGINWLKASMVASSRKKEAAEYAKILRVVTDAASIKASAPDTPIFPRPIVPMADSADINR